MTHEHGARGREVRSGGGCGVRVCQKCQSFYNGGLR